MPQIGMNAQSTYTISDLSKHLDLTPRTIRFYESEGLLNPERTNGKRSYRERDLVRLKLILRGKRLGFSLAEIKTTLELYDTQPNETAQLKYVLAIIETHRQELLQKQQDITNTLDEMEAVAEQVQVKLETLRDHSATKINIKPSNLRKLT
ncbi:MerR family transcriptional regulator [Candidatus Spongiihabitans sp.]|uniref:MerR family transcriptional regulator n=1 Tax=Candidatus Spongiihabitans sp. TaxID=3101308 RepID=UPI003C79C82A